MTSFMVPAGEDAARPRQSRPISFTLDGERIDALEGQTIAGALLATGRTSWRSTTEGEPRGVFCGIGVCFDCIVTVGEARDVRACMRRAQDGDVVTTQDDGDPEVTL